MRRLAALAVALLMIVPWLSSAAPADATESAAVAATADAPQFTERSYSSVKGTGAAGGIGFQSTYSNSIPKLIVVTLTFGSKTFTFTWSKLTATERQLDTIRVSSSAPADRLKARGDHDRAVQLLQTLQPQMNATVPVENGIALSVDFLVNMIPLDEPFEVLDLRPAFAVRPAASGYTMICAQRGTVQTGTFDDLSNNVYQANVLVGSPSNQCYGRCGVGCVQALQSTPRQYTRECLNHDLCAAHFNENFGNCQNEWNTASVGYLLAPNCSFYVSGIWAISFQWKGQPTTSTTITFLSNGTFTATDGSKGSYTLSGATMTIKASTGCKAVYTGSLSSTNQTVSGTSKCSSSLNKGTFSATYVTATPGVAPSVVAPVQVSSVAKDPASGRIGFDGNPVGAQ